MSFFDAPMTFAGFAALSVETQKNRSAPERATRSSRRTLASTLFRTIASIEKRSFSLRTCLCAAKCATTSNGPSAANSRANVGLPKSIG